MPLYLKQSTASQEIPLGVFVDETDGKTAETGLTINNTDIKLWKAGGTTLANKNSGGATHISGGIYYAVLDATDTDTLGPLVIFVHVSGALPVRVECAVTTANWYDTLHGTDKLDVNVEEWNATSVPGEHTAGYPIVTVKDGTGTGELDSNTGRVLADVTYWNGSAVATPDTAGYPKVTVKSGTGTGEVSLLSGAVLLQPTQTGVTIPTVTAVTNGVTVASNGIAAVSFQTGAITAGALATDAISAAALAADAGTEIADAVWDRPMALNTDAGSFGLGVGAIKTKTDYLPSATAGAAGGVFIAGTNAATTITSSAGSALTLSSTGSNGHGLLAQGHGTGSGITGSGGGTSGHGIYAAGDGDGMGIYATGGDGTVTAGLMVKSNATLTQYGLYVEDGAVVTNAHGVGMAVSSTATDQHGMTVTGNGTGGDLVADVTGNVSGSVGSIATGGIATTSFANGAITATALAPNCITSSELGATAIEAIADGILDRNMATGTDSGSATVRTPRQALRFLRNKWSTSGTTLTVTKEDDTTTSWAGELTPNASADPITGLDPASS